MRKINFKNLHSSFKDFSNNFGIIFIVFIFTLVIVNISYIFISLQNNNQLIVQQESVIREQMSIVDFAIRTEISNTYHDLLVIKDSDEYDNYINNPTANNLSETEQLFYRIAVNKPGFYNIRFLDITGQEIIKAINEGADTSIAAPENLYDKSETYYFEAASQLNANEFYISNIDISEDSVIPTEQKIILRFVLPVYDDLDIKQGYLVINLDAYLVLSVFSEYVGNDSSYSELGLLSNNIFYQFSKSDSSTSSYVINVIENPENIYGPINSEFNYTSDVHIEENLIGIFSADDDFLTIFSNLDTETLLDEQGGFFYNHFYILILINLVFLALFFYIGSVLKSRNDDRVLLNANTYLSDTNNDSVIIIDADKTIFYVNEIFKRIYKYSLKETQNKSLDSILNSQINVILNRVKDNNQVLESFEWNTTRSNINMLSLLKVNTIKSIRENIKYYVAVYSNPDFDNRSILENIPEGNNPADFSDVVKTISKVFYRKPLIINSTLIFLIKIDYTIQNYFEYASSEIQINLFEDLREKLNDDYSLFVPTRNNIIISVDADLKNKDISYYHNLIVKLLDNFKYSHSKESSISYVISSDYAKDEYSSYEGIIFNIFGAMEFSKNIVVQKYLPYDNNMRQILKRENLIRMQLDSGFKKDEFYLNYQVQEQLSDNKVTGVEALLRWNNKDLGIIPPNDFIPIIENSYYINSLSLMVINKVIKDFENHHKEIPDRFRISINLTSYDFHNEMIIKEIVNRIENSKLKTRNFCFEITESGYLENTDKINSIIDYLHSKDIIIAIDDFGRGFSSLSSLKNIHVDNVKVDRMFIKDYPKNDDGLMHRTIASLINSLGKKIVIEGTETIDQIELAKSTNCHEHQGYYVSRPLNFNEFFNRFVSKK